MKPNEMLGVMLWLSIIIVMKVGFVGMAVLIQHAKSDFIARATVNFKKKPRKLMMLLGLVNGLGIPFLAIVMISTEILALPGVVLLLIYLCLVLLSFTVIYRAIGEKITDETDSNHEFKATLYGGLIAEAAFFIPVLGQLYAILLFIRSLGAILLTMVKLN